MKNPKGATGLIIALARDKAKKGNPSASDDYKAAARALLAAVKKESVDDLASALESFDSLRGSLEPED